MNIHLITIGQQLPTWVNTAYDEYAKRMPRDYQLILHQLPMTRRSKSVNLRQVIAKESHVLLSACPPHSYRIALDRQGSMIDTEQIAANLVQWHDHAQNISLLIGGPDGVSPEMLQQVETIWSLSALTLPHPFVRILIAEQIYRAWSILSNHPYHRGA